MLGALSPDALPDFYGSLDVLVVPSLPTPNWVEQFGWVVVEAMASGTAVVASRSGALAEMVGEAGLLVPPGDPEALHAWLATLAGDPERHRALAQAGTARTRRWSWSALAAEQRALYDHLRSGTGYGRSGTHTPVARPGDTSAPAPASCPPDLDRSAAATPSRPPSFAEGPQAPPPIIEVVVAYRRADLLERCLGTLRCDDSDPFPVVVVDDASDPSVAAVAGHHGVQYLDPGANLGFAAGVNRGIEALGHTDADVLLLDPDAEVAPVPDGAQRADQLLDLLGTLGSN